MPQELNADVVTAAAIGRSCSAGNKANVESGAVVVVVVVVVDGNIQ